MPAAGFEVAHGRDEGLGLGRTREIWRDGVDAYGATADVAVEHGLQQRRSAGSPKAAMTCSVVSGAPVSGFGNAVKKESTRSMPSTPVERAA